ANRAPVPVADAYTVPANGTRTINLGSLLANDTDPDGDSFRVIGDASAFTPQHGTVEIIPINNDYNSPDSFLVYKPNAGYLGPDTITYRVSDGQLSAPAQINISVLAAEFSGLEDRTINYGLPFLTLGGNVVVNGASVNSPTGFVVVTIPGYASVTTH